jgi:hypothetical protein
MSHSHLKSHEAATIEKKQTVCVSTLQDIIFYRPFIFKTKRIIFVSFAVYYLARNVYYNRTSNGLLAHLLKKINKKIEKLK